VRKCLSRDLPPDFKTVAAALSNLAKIEVCPNEKFLLNWLVCTNCH
jgi:hypothetical protein